MLFWISHRSTRPGWPVTSQSFPTTSAVREKSSSCCLQWSAFWRPCPGPLSSPCPGAQTYPYWYAGCLFWLLFTVKTWCINIRWFVTTIIQENKLTQNRNNHGILVHVDMWIPVNTGIDSFLPTCSVICLRISKWCWFSWFRRGLSLCSGADGCPFISSVTAQCRTSDLL